MVKKYYISISANDNYLLVLVLYCIFGIQNQTCCCLFMISLLLDPESHIEQQLHCYQPMIQLFCKSSSDRFVARSALFSSRLPDLRALNKFLIDLLLDVRLVLCHIVFIYSMAWSDGT